MAWREVAAGPGFRLLTAVLPAGGEARAEGPASVCLGSHGLGRGPGAAPPWSPVAVRPGEALANPAPVPALVYRLEPDAASVLFFGSRARGDHRPDSDCDLLVAAPAGAWTEARHGRVSVSAVPRLTLRRMAAAGDPFARELARDARPLLGGGAFLDRLRAIAARAAPAPRHDAGPLARVLLRPEARARDPALVARRLHWCLRAMLIARGRRVFGDPDLSPEERALLDRALLARKGGAALDALAPALAAWMDANGVPAGPPGGLGDAEAAFAAGGFDFARDTLAQLRGAQAPGGA